MADEYEGSGNVNIKRDAFILIFITIMIGVLLDYLGLKQNQVIASSILAATVVGTLLFWGFRVAIAFMGIITLLLTKTLDIPHLIEFASLEVILFLVGMMTVVGMLKEVGFFRWLMIKIIKITNFEAHLLLIVFCILSAFLAMAIDEVTSIIFITAVLLEITDYFDVNPVPYVISCVLATNIGSSGTVLGNPIGILIAMRGELSFEDFIIWAFPVAMVSLLATIVIVLFWYRNDIALFKSKIRLKIRSTEKLAFQDEWEFVPNKRDFKIGVGIFVFTIAVIAMHRRLETLFDLPYNTLLLVSSLLGASLVMLWKRNKAREYIEKDVDWWTLVFFMMLFAKVGTLKFTGATDVLAQAVAGIAGSLPILTTIVLWIASLGSSVLDNVVLVAALIPVVDSFKSLGINTFPLWWALLFGGCYGGNITMIGSTANIVALGILEKRKKYRMSFLKWLWIGLAVGGVSTLIANIILIFLIPYM
jgi:Na+/H+ antiporter NhaD/arsenite permease-like protein